MHSRLQQNGAYSLLAIFLLSRCPSMRGRCRRLSQRKSEVDSVFKHKRRWKSLDSSMLTQRGGYQPYYDGRENACKGSWLTPSLPFSSSPITGRRPKGNGIAEDCLKGGFRLQAQEYILAEMEFIRHECKGKLMQEIAAESRGLKEEFVSHG
ncbi:hypothetical protein GOP47_0005830 [Adiantum capillus-veneris]|uniref:Uncharacterized protein n=1 Tax=Adiantum capillus-veneris TaxID=13818 RepID=A0A9D4ZNW8_ADICA|nr:hypothetical protein GOP47_0005830 [Adiantum capillus-veneris]